MAAYCAIAVASFLAVSVDDFLWKRTLTAVLACFNNIGPGLDLVGPASNYSPVFNFFQGCAFVGYASGQTGNIPHYCAVQPPYLEPHALKTGYGRLWARPAQAAAARLFAFLHIFVIVFLFASGRTAGRDPIDFRRVVFGYPRPWYVPGTAAFAGVLGVLLGKRDGAFVVNRIRMKNKADDGDKKGAARAGPFR